MSTTILTISNNGGTLHSPRALITILHIESAQS
jgi:hypothetical protein